MFGIMISMILGSTDLNDLLYEQGYRDIQLEGEHCQCDPDSYQPIYFLEGSKCKKQYCLGGGCVPVIHPKPKPMDKGMITLVEVASSNCESPTP